jgi:hypothetical protein
MNTGGSSRQTRGSGNTGGASTTHTLWPHAEQNPGQFDRTGAPLPSDNPPLLGNYPPHIDKRTLTTHLLKSIRKSRRELKTMFKYDYGKYVMAKHLEDQDQMTLIIGRWASAVRRYIIRFIRYSRKVGTISTAGADKMNLTYRADNITTMEDGQLEFMLDLYPEELLCAAWRAEYITENFGKRPDAEVAAARDRKIEGHRQKLIAKAAKAYAMNKKFAAFANGERSAPCIPPWERVSPWQRVPPRNRPAHSDQNAQPAAAHSSVQPTAASSIPRWKRPATSNQNVQPAAAHSSVQPAAAESIPPWLRPAHSNQNVQPAAAHSSVQPVAANQGMPTGTPFHNTQPAASGAYHPVAPNYAVQPVAHAFASINLGGQSGGFTHGQDFGAQHGSFANNQNGNSYGAQHSGYGNQHGSTPGTQPNGYSTHHANYPAPPSLHANSHMNSYPGAQHGSSPGVHHTIHGTQHGAYAQPIKPAYPSAQHGNFPPTHGTKRDYTGLPIKPSPSSSADERYYSASGSFANPPPSGPAHGGTYIKPEPTDDEMDLDRAPGRDVDVDMADDDASMDISDDEIKSEDGDVYIKSEFAGSG